MTTELKKRYSRQIAALEKAIDCYQHSESGGRGGKRKPGRVAYVCGCDRKIYVAPGVADLGGIRCEICEELFSSPANPSPAKPTPNLWVSFVDAVAKRFAGRENLDDDMANEIIEDVAFHGPDPQLAPFYQSLSDSDYRRLVADAIRAAQNEAKGMEEKEK